MINRMVTENRYEMNSAFEMPFSVLTAACMILLSSNSRVAGPMFKDDNCGLAGVFIYGVVTLCLL